MNDVEWLGRSRLLIGEEKLQKLIASHVMVIGLGGVGSFAAEFICRNGVGKITIIDGDVVDPTNRNRQLPALATNHGMFKTAIMEERLRSINPEIEITTVAEFISPEMVEKLLQLQPDFIIDAIDSVTPKLTFIKIALQHQIPMVSSMGAGGKLDPTQIQVADISKTFNCPFAQQLRKMLKKDKIYTGLQAVFSPEENVKESLMMTDGSNYKKSAYGTMSYMPAAFGGVAASVALRHIMNKK